MAVATTWTVHHRCGHDQDHDPSKKPPSLCGTRRKGQLETNGRAAKAIQKQDPRKEL
jgi:hypothetical protein